MISGRELGSVIATHAGGPGRPEGRPPAPPASVANAAPDGVTLSPQSANVGRWLTVLKGMSDIRTNRVESVGSRVASGQGPSSTDVARQMLSRMVGDRLAASG